MPELRKVRAIRSRRLSENTELGQGDLGSSRAALGRVPSAASPPSVLDLACSEQHRPWPRWLDRSLSLGKEAHAWFFERNSLAHALSLEAALLRLRAPAENAAPGWMPHLEGTGRAIKREAFMFSLSLLFFGRVKM